LVEYDKLALLAAIQAVDLVELLLDVLVDL